MEDEYLEYLKKHHPDSYQKEIIQNRLLSRFHKAHEFERAGKIEEAINQYKMNYNDSPTWASVDRLVILYHRLGHIEKETHLLEKAIIDLKDKTADFIIDKLRSRLNKILSKKVAIKGE